MLKRIFILIFCIVNFYNTNGQVFEQGMPFIKNYTTKDYNAHTQNFGMTSDSRGVLYFANFSGVLEFDGESWKLITTENGYRVTSIKSDNYGRVFVGGLGECGFLKPDTLTGELYFKSIISLEYTAQDELVKVENIYYNISKIGEKIFLETKNVLINNLNDVFFVTQKGIIKYSNNKLSLFYESKNQIVSASIINEKIYILENNNQISKIEDNSINLITISKEVEELYSIDFMIEMNTDSILIGSGKAGLYILKNDTIFEKDYDCESYFLENELSCGLLIPNGNIVIGTLRGGVVEITTTGKIIQKIQISEGLNSESVSSLYISKEQNLWATLYNGISQIQMPSSLTYYNQMNGLSGEIIDIEKFENKIYAATIEGLFYLEENVFIKSSIIRYPCNALEISGNELFVATNNGVFSLKNNSLTKISENFAVSLFYDKEANNLYIGMLDGVYLFTNNNSWILSKKLNNIDFEIWNILKDNKNNIWFQSSTDGIIKYSLEKDLITLYDVSKGLPSLSSNQLNIVDNEIFIGTEKGIFKYNSENDMFEKSSLFVSNINFSKFLTVIYGKSNLDKFFYESSWISDLKTDKFGNIWSNQGNKKGISVYLKNDSYFVKSKTTFLPVKEFIAKKIFCDTISGITWFGGDEGIIRYNPQIAENFDIEYNTIIRKVKLKNDSIIFEGTFFDKNMTPENIQTNTFVKEIDFNYNTINFSFSAASYNTNENIMYQYFLDGFDQNWSELTSKSTKEYTNLPEGEYTFYVKSQNIYGVSGSTAQFKFEILTPLHRRWWAIAIYILLFISVVYLLIRWRLKILQKEKEELEKIVKERTEEIENQKEELKSQSDELADKNQELERIDQIVQSINSEINFGSLLKSLLQKLVSMTGMDLAVALIYDRKVDTFKYKSSIGIDFTMLENHNINLDDANSDYIKNAAEVYDGIYYTNTLKHLKTDNWLHKSKSMLTILVEVNDKVEGFLIITSTKYYDAFRERDFSFAKNLKEHINTAFIKAQILENLQDTLTNLKDTQDELIRKEKLASVGQLTKGIVDRLINPMNYINNFSDISKDLSKEIKEIIISDKNIKPETVEEAEDVLNMLVSNLDKIHNHGVSSARIVKGMEKLLKEKSTQFKDIDLEELINNSINRAVTEFKSENADFKVDIIKNIGKDFEQINALSNEFTDSLIYLINNACYAVHQKSIVDKNFKPSIEISTFKTKENSVIKIKDNGIGIVENELKHIFEPFFTTKPTAKGTGLGLFMAQDIIKIHKGEIIISSKQNEFTEVLITLPK